MTKPLILAHRGARADAPENTLPAFELALEMGADGVEFDVWLSADGVPVVIHDETVDGTTDGSGKVETMTADALRRLDAGSHFGESFAGTRIPTLAEVLDGLPREAWLNIELKGTDTERLPNAVSGAITRVGRTEPMIISTFNPHMLEAVRGVLPAIPRAFLTPPDVGYGAWMTDRAQWWHPHHGALTADDIARAREGGQRVNTWTVNTAGALKRVTQLGVDGIITDHPDRALDVIDELLT